MNGRALLVRTWGALALGAALTGAGLQWLGPPPGVRRPVVAATRPLASPHVSTRPGTIALPDPALLAADPSDPALMLPVVGPDGRASATVYAAPVPRVLPNQARLALVVDGIGLDGATSEAAIRELPAPVSLAFSPYGAGLAALASLARARGHEMLVSVPMEPRGSPDNDEGDRQLSPANSDATNQHNLHWALGSIEGYVGVTGAENGQSGEHMLDDRASLAMLADRLAARGLIFVDPRPGASDPAAVAASVANVRIDGASELVDEEAGLQALVAAAQRDGQALGILGPLRPGSLARLMAWVRTLPGLGIVLVPVSSLAQHAPSEVTDASPAGAGGGQ